MGSRLGSHGGLPGVAGSRTPEAPGIWLNDDAKDDFFVDMARHALETWEVDVTGLWLELRPHEWWFTSSRISPDRLRLVPRPMSRPPKARAPRSNEPVPKLAAEATIMDESEINEIRVSRDLRPWPLFWSDLRWIFRALDPPTSIRDPCRDPSSPLAFGTLGVADHLLDRLPRTPWILGHRARLLPASFPDRPFSIREVPTLTGQYFARFLRLLIVAAVFVALFLVVVLVEVGVHQRTTGTGSSLPLRVYLSTLFIVFLADVALTFVSPALVFTTSSAWEALRFGLRLLRTTWPNSVWYVLTPGLARRRRRRRLDQLWLDSATLESI